MFKSASIRRTVVAGAVSLMIVGASAFAFAAGERIAIPRGSATVDGTLNSWTFAPSIKLPSGWVADATDVKDDKDLSAQVYARWDDAFLYLAFDVNDDVLVFERSGGDIWQTDAVEFWLGGSQYGATIDASGKAVLHSWGGADISKAKVAVQPNSKGYVVEVAVPAEVVARDIGKAWAPGVTFPFAVGMDDADTKGGSREGQIYLPKGWQWGATNTFATAVLE